MTVAIVFNPISGTGRGRASAEALCKGLEAAGREVELIPSEPRPSSEWLRPRLREGLEALVAVGGDGAVRLAAPEAVRFAVPLWHAPLGTENLFARFHGMGASVDELLKALDRPRHAWIDLGSADGVPFVLMASVGFDAEVVHRVDARRTGGISHLSYLAPILELLGEWRSGEVSWEIDGEFERLGRGTVVVSSHPAYGLSLVPSPDARPDDGLLDAAFLPASRGIGALAWGPLLRTGLHRRVRGVRFRRGATIALHLEPPARLQIDGDPLPGGPRARVEFSVAARCLPILLPHGG